MNETRLEKLCKAFGWQGGTIHQAAQELKTVYRMDTVPDIIGMDDETFERLINGIEVLKYLDSFLGASQ